MKKLIAIMLCALLLITAIACSGKPEPSPAPAVEQTPETGNTEPEPEPIEEALSGGWAVVEDAAMTDALRAIFEKGMTELVGVNYTPVALLGTQVVAGTNYCFLAQGTEVYPDAAPKFMIVYLYEDLTGAVSLMKIEDLPIVAGDDGKLSAPAEPGTLTGGWEYADSFEVTDEMKANLEKALSGMVGATYEPIANLGTQVVAGLNRCLLCRVTPVVPDAVPHYALVYVYEDLEGGAELNNVVDYGIEMSQGEPEAEPNAEVESAVEAEAEAAVEAETEAEAEAEAAVEAEAAEGPIVLPELPNEDPADVVAGGWQVSLEPEMTEALAAIFAKALDGLVGVDYEPVACLGTQIVAGTNYCFLAKAKVVYPDAQPSYVLVYVYEDLEGNARVMNFADMPVVPNEYGSAEPITAEETLSGGWFYTESPEITDEIRDAFAKGQISNGYIAVYDLIANLAEQIVAGTNRCLLVRITERIPDAASQYKLVYVYEALDGSAEITSMLDFDFGALCTYGA